MLPEGIDRTEESYKREIMKLRIENERLKKRHGADERKWRTGVCSFKAEELDRIEALSRDYSIHSLCDKWSIVRI